MIATAAVTTIAFLVFAWFIADALSKPSLRTTDVERAKGPSLEVQP